MRKIVSALIGAIVLLAGGARADTFPAKGDPGHATIRHLKTVDGERRYLVQPVPGGKGLPVVILLHGGTQDARRIWKQTSLPTLGLEKHFIMVAPDGLDGHWNDGRGSTIAADAPSSADDLAFLDAVIADVVARDGGDPNAVFMAGVSNGGFMTMHFVCSGRYPLRAGANLISTLPVAAQGACHPRHPTPWLSLNGTTDTLIPFDGQPAGARRRGGEQPALLSAEATFDFFATKAGCTGAGESRHLPDLDPRDGSTVLMTEKACPGGGHATRYVVEGGGHITPGLKVGPVIARMVGGANMDVDTGTLLWSFFQSRLP